jgi:hypothetical protein
MILKELINSAKPRMKFHFELSCNDYEKYYYLAQALTLLVCVS